MRGSAQRARRLQRESKLISAAAKTPSPVWLSLKSGQAYVRHANSLGIVIVFTDMQNGEERLGALDVTDLLHARFLTFFLFQSSFFLTDAAAVTHFASTFFLRQLFYRRTGGQYAYAIAA